MYIVFIDKLLLIYILSVIGIDWGIDTPTTNALLIYTIVK